MGVVRKTYMPVLLRGAAAFCLLMAFFACQRAWAASPPPGAHILNTVKAEYKDAGGTAFPSVTATADTLAVAGGPRLTLTESGSPDPVWAGNKITFTIKVTNSGSVALTGVSVSDPVPSGSTFVSASGGASPAGGTVTWSIGPMAPGDSKTLRLTVRTDTDTLDGAVMDNPVSAASNETPAQPATANARIKARTNGIVKFYNSSWVEVNNYNIGDRVYVEVTDTDQNTDPAVAETITVVLKHLHRDPGGTASWDDQVTVTLTETGPDTGVFRDLAGVLSIPGPPTPAETVDDKISIEPLSEIVTVYTDPFDPAPIHDAAAFIDPYGIVFDSSTGAPVAGVVVTLIDLDTGLPAAPPHVPLLQPSVVTTPADGSFSFPSVAVNVNGYKLSLGSLGSYTFPSIVPTATLLSLNVPPPVGPAPVIVVGSRGERFDIVGPILNLDLPVDPPAGDLKATKTADTNTATIGDMVRYTVKLTNNGPSATTGARLFDTMPHGVVIVKGSTLINGVPAPDPAETAGRTVVWDIGTVASGGSVEVVYRAAVGPDSDKGDGVNMAQAQAVSLGQPVISNRAEFTLRIREGVFTDRSVVIGKVFIDNDGDGVQQAGEPGIPGAVIYMEDGARVITDKDGKYSIISVAPGTHVLRLDETSLPKGAEPIPTSSRSSGDGASQFVDTVRGLIMKADFAVKVPADAVLEAPTTEKLAAAAPDAKPGDAPEAAPEDPYEAGIKDMTPELDILEPRDGGVVTLKKINVVVKFMSEMKLTLYVNGEAVDEGQIGKRLAYAPTKTAIHRFVGVGIKEGEKNILRAEAKDPFGNIRAVREITITTPGRPVKVVVSPSKTESPADGATVTELSVSAYDAGGHIAAGRDMVTITATAGDILNDDLAPSVPGVQVAPEMGAVKVRLRSPRETGEGKVTVQCGDVEETASVYFSPHLRGMLINGVGEAVVGYGFTHGDTSPLRDKGWLDSGVYGGGRGAFFLKGDIGRGFLLTAAYDSMKKKNDTGLFNEKIKDVESEARYPVYGDESRQAYEAESNDKLYVRIDKDRSYLLYGDYNTGLNDTKLSAFSRTFTGAKVDVDTGMLKLRGFASHTNHTLVVDKLQGKGIAGYYTLSKSPVTDGSEMVMIETRDRREPDLVLKREVMARWSDYYIDYSIGAILFKGPVPTCDADLNPVYIIVSYEAESPADTFYVYGGRASVRPSSWLEAGFTGMVEEKAVSDYRLLGADTTVALPFGNTLRAEWAQTDSLFTLNNAVTAKGGSAWMTRIDGKPLKGLDYSAYYYNAGRYFDNPSAVDIPRGKERWGFEGSYNLGEHTQLRGRFLDEEDRLNNMNHIYGSAGIATAFGDTKAGLDLYHESSTERFVPASSPDTRAPFDLSEELPDRVTALKARVETKIWKKLSLEAERSQDIQRGRDNVTQAGLNYQYSDTARFYAREQYLELEGRSQTRTVIGEESSIAKNTIAYSEYRLGGGMGGNGVQQSIGLKNKFNLGEGVTGNLAIERLSTISGNEKAAEPDAISVSTGVEYLPKEDLKTTARVEFRDATNDITRLMEMGVAYKVGRDLAMFLKGRYFDDRPAGSGSRSVMLASTGLAYRPVEDSRFNALGKVEFKRERNLSSGSSQGANYLIFSLEGVYQASRKLQLTGKYAGKLATNGEFGSYTDLITARALYDITDNIDIGVSYRVLTNWRTGARSHGGAAEAGYKVWENIWLSAGYSFDRFDADLTQDDYEGQGPYVKLRVKLDEKTFKHKD